MSWWIWFYERLISFYSCLLEKRSFLYVDLKEWQLGLLNIMIFANILVIEIVSEQDISVYLI